MRNVYRNLVSKPEGIGKLGDLSVDGLDGTKSDLNEIESGMDLSGSR
jgi:hypothetical protein